MEELTMKEIVEFLKKNVNGNLATIDHGMPRVRPFGFILYEDERLYFCTNSLKDVYKQLLEVPYIEYVATSKEMVTMRISGKINFCDDIEMKEKVLNVFDSIKAGYKTADNPIFKVFYLEHGAASISEFSGKPMKKVNF